MFRELGHVVGIASSLLNLGAVARYQGAREQAAALLEESRCLSEGIGFREGIAWSLEQLGLLAADRGDPGAAPLLRRSLEVHRELRDRWRTCSVLEDLAALALARGSAAQAVRLLAAAETMRGAIGTVIAPCESAQHAETVAGARAALGDDTFTAAWQQGLLAPIDDLQAELPTADTARGVPGAADRAAAARPGWAVPAGTRRSGRRPARHLTAGSHRPDVTRGRTPKPGRRGRPQAACSASGRSAPPPSTAEIRW